MEKYVQQKANGSQSAANNTSKGVSLKPPVNQFSLEPPIQRKQTSDKKVNFYNNVGAKLVTGLMQQGIAKEKAYFVLGQVLQENGWDQEAPPGNNYFNIKGDFNGQSQTLDTFEEDQHGNKSYIADEFRVYENLEQSTADYLDLLNRLYPQAYDALYNSEKNINDFVNGLANGTIGRYATDVDYSEKVTTLSNQVAREFEAAVPHFKNPEIEVKENNQNSGSEKNNIKGIEIIKNAFGNLGGLFTKSTLKNNAGETTQEDIPRNNKSKGIVSTKALNVRKGPGTTFDKAGLLNKDDEIKILKEKDFVDEDGNKTTWYKIGKKRWVSSKYIDVINTSEKTKTKGEETDKKTEAISSDLGTVIINSSTLNIRTGPSTDFEKISNLKLGNKVNVYEEKDNWFRIGQDEWISGKYTYSPKQGEDKPNWINIAENEIGTTEIKGAEHNQKVIDYHSTTTGDFKDDETAWCASFVRWVMLQDGHSIEDSFGAWAQSWKNYGKKLDQAAYGAIAVIKWDADSGHVGFVVGKKGNKVMLLGGNQSDSVRVTEFSESDIIAYVVPSSYTLPESAYQLDELSGPSSEAGFAQTR